MGSDGHWRIPVILVAAAAGLAGFFRWAEHDDQERRRLTHVPATFIVNAGLRVPQSRTSDMEDALVALGRRYGFRAEGSPAPEGREWQVQMWCRGQIVALAHTAGKGEELMGTLLIYGFEDRADYDRFKGEFVQLFEHYGVLQETKSGEILSDQELAARAKYMDKDFSSRCSPPGRAASAAAMPSGRALPVPPNQVTP